MGFSVVGLGTVRWVVLAFIKGKSDLLLVCLFGEVWRVFKIGYNW